MLEPCPDCGARFAPHTGPTHRYIGASAACWALYSELLVGVMPTETFLASSAVDARDDVAIVAPPGLEMVLVDAYAAQHHGVPSPRAIQSVAVHLLVLHGILCHGVDPANAQWVRGRALRRRGMYRWLTPPVPTQALTLRHLFPGAGHRVRTSGEYVASVHASWASAHGGTLEDWYRTHVLGN